MKHPKIPYRCKNCRKRFSIKVEMPVAGSNLPLNKWLLVAYQDLTNLKGISSQTFTENDRGKDLNKAGNSALTNYGGYDHAPG